MAKHMDYIEFYNFYYEHYIAFSRCESAKLSGVMKKLRTIQSHMLFSELRCLYGRLEIDKSAIYATASDKDL